MWIQELTFEYDTPGQAFLTTTIHKTVTVATTATPAETTAATKKQQKHRMWRRWGVVPACLCICTGELQIQIQLPSTVLGQRSKRRSARCLVTPAVPVRWLLPSSWYILLYPAPAPATGEHNMHVHRDIQQRRRCLYRTRGNGLKRN